MTQDEIERAQAPRLRLIQEVLRSASAVQLIAFRQRIWENYCAGWSYYDMEAAIAAIDNRSFDSPSLAKIILDSDIMYVMRNF